MDTDPNMVTASTGSSASHCGGRGAALFRVVSKRATQRDLNETCGVEMLWNGAALGSWRTRLM